MKHYLGVFAYAIIGGICIALGGTAFLQVNDGTMVAKVIGAFLFGIGLFAICTRGYNLFTGKACYVLDNDASYIIDLIIIWLGNFVGAFLTAYVETSTRIVTISAAAQSMVDVKMGDSLISLFLLGIICNIFIYIAVNGYKTNPHEIGKYLSIFLGVSIFILCGTEHSVADMYYWCVSGTFTAMPAESLLRIIVVSAGNIVGGILFPAFEKFYKYSDSPSKEKLRGKTAIGAHAKTADTHKA